MAFWWVNHKQTYKEELEGGYIWSPKENRNGSRNPTYINLTHVQIGDVIFSYANSALKAVGLSGAPYKTADKPMEFGSKGENWDQKGWLVRINWEVVSNPLIPKNYLEDIVPLLPKKYSPIQSNGNGNQGCYLAGISDHLGDFLLKKLSFINPEIDIALESIRLELEDDRAEKAIYEDDAGETEKEQVVKARRGQGVFRTRVKEKETRCRVTGVDVNAILVASHIKPWSKCTNNERLDGNNGLLLSPHVDKLFDLGWISFTKTGDILYFNEATIELMKTWGIDTSINVGSFSREQAGYLEYHRLKVFKKVT